MDTAILENSTIVKKEKISLLGDNALGKGMNLIATKCDHVFHESCLKDWVDTFLNRTSAASCPMCRRELAEPHIKTNIPSVPAPPQTPIAEPIQLPHYSDAHYQNIPHISRNVDSNLGRIILFDLESPSAEVYSNLGNPIAEVD